METTRQIVYFPGEAEEFREVELEIVPSKKMISGGGLPLDVPAPSYRLAGYIIEPLNNPARPDVVLQARKMT